MISLGILYLKYNKWLLFQKKCPIGSFFLWKNEHLLQYIENFCFFVLLYVCNFAIQKKELCTNIIYLWAAAHSVGKKALFRFFSALFFVTCFFLPAAMNIITPTGNPIFWGRTFMTTLMKEATSRILSG